MARHHAEHLRRQRQARRRDAVLLLIDEQKRQGQLPLQLASPPVEAFIRFGGSLEARLKEYQRNAIQMTKRQIRTARREAIRDAIRQQIKTKFKRVPTYREVADQATQIIRKMGKPRFQRKGVM